MSHGKVVSIARVALILVFSIGAGPLLAQDMTYTGSADLNDDANVDNNDLNLLMQQWHTDGRGTAFPCNLPQSMNLTNSLHFTTEGMRTFFDDIDSGTGGVGLGRGFGPIIGVEYDEVSCKNCHTNSCTDCHATTTSHLENDTCFVCHGRQKTALGPLGLSDYHITNATFECARCHTSEEIHGDGNMYDSMLNTGMQVGCLGEGCHSRDSLTDRSEHTTHIDFLEIDCRACHQTSSITCYNCHFDTEINEQKKIHVGPKKDYLLLVNDKDGKVTAGTYMALYHRGDAASPAEGDSFVVYAPFYSHTITREGARLCPDCHGNSNVDFLDQNDTFPMATLNTAQDNVDHATGVIPIVDGKTYQFQFFDNAGTSSEPNWVPAKIGPDNIQFGFCTPLTADQFDSLK